MNSKCNMGRLGGRLEQPLGMRRPCLRRESLHVSEMVAFRYVYIHSLAHPVKFIVARIDEVHRCVFYIYR